MAAPIRSVLEIVAAPLTSFASRELDLPATPGARVLDIGCGSGSNERGIAFGNDTRLIGIVTVTPTTGGEPAEVVLNWGTTVYDASGAKASGVSVLTVGQPVQVWLQRGSTTATRINISQ